MNSPAHRLAVRAVAAALSAAAVVYGALVWLGMLPNLPEWHYYPKVWMLVGLAGLLLSARCGRDASTGHPSATPES